MDPQLGTGQYGICSVSRTDEQLPSADGLGHRADALCRPYLSTWTSEQARGDDCGVSRPQRHRTRFAKTRTAAVAAALRWELVQA